MSTFSLMRGILPAQLANAVSDAINAALQAGMEVDEAVCTVVGVASDYAKGEYGPDYLDQLARVVVAYKERDMRKREDAPK